MRNVIPGLIMWLIAAGLLALPAYYVYDFSLHGTMDLVGQMVGSGVVLTAILWFAGKKYSKWMRVSSAALLAALLLTFNGWDELTTAFDFKSAQPLIAAAKTEEQLARTIAENPSNRSLRLLGIGLENSANTREQVAALYANLEPAEIQQLDRTLDELTGPELIAVSRSLRLAQQNAHDAANLLPTIYGESVKKTTAALSFASKSTSKGLISGIMSRHEREVPHLVKSFRAQEAMYRALADQAEFLLLRQGGYTKTASGLEFVDATAIEPWNELYRKIQVTVTQVQAVEKEGTELKQYQAEGWAKMQEGSN